MKQQLRLALNNVCQHEAHLLSLTTGSHGQPDTWMEDTRKGPFNYSSFTSRTADDWGP